MTTIHVAYAFERRNNCFRARAYVGDYRKPLHSVTVAIGDTPDEAVNGAVAYVMQMHDRDGVARPSEIIRYGKVAGLTLDHLAF